MRIKGTKDNFEKTGGLRHLLLICFCAVTTVFLSAAQENLPVLTVGSTVYSNVTVTSVSYTDVYFKYADGETNAKLKDIDPKLQKRYNYEPTRAKAAEQKLAAENAKYLFRAGNATNREPSTDAEVKAEMDSATARVKAIVNQPVRNFLKGPDVKYVIYPYWFHDGASKPDFDHVDIRQTQDLHYATQGYVTSDLNPGVLWAGAELEFNTNTKYFYTDRSVPKKRLTEAEMLEINRLYRIIGEDEELLIDIKNPPKDP